ncbi:hypothetical protein [Maribacter sp. 2210JD10-5]|uniref:hypothetical protein n=1 Tax=Maribacter sp. 2210JD10-5 TaxID=3386272 RepID=UPI0039BCE5C3
MSLYIIGFSLAWFLIINGKPKQPMRITILTLIAILIFQSCVPLRIAPNIDDYKISKGKRFKRSLSKRQMFIFDDPKEAEAFYNFVNIKFQLDHLAVYDDIPFKIDEQQYFFAWYEVEIPNKTLNLAPMLVHLAVGAALGDNDPLENYDSGNEIVRNGNWYIAIEVYNDLESDCLTDSSVFRESVLKYLRDLKKEYLATYNYNETVFKN